MMQKQTAHIFTVSKLTRQIKTVLEDSFPFVWITGEISNYSVPGSGHSYFTLKDDQAVISCVMFKNQKRGLKFSPQNGLKIFGLARLSLYEPRGSYQLIFEHLEPEGAGSAQIAFEQLKTKLADKGYFKPELKKSIPVLPNTVYVITSPTGAAVKDIINISLRRFPNCCLNIIPVQVQGEKAVHDICQALELANKHNLAQVIILARGGGTLEDLAAFNAEPVADAIFESTIPVVTGIGHETDFTIADFVSDLRAPTPSAAAELVIPDKKSMIHTVHTLEKNLNRSMSRQIKDSKQKVAQLSSRIKSPQNILFDLRFKLDDLNERLKNRLKLSHELNRQKLCWLNDALKVLNPAALIFNNRQQVQHSCSALNHHMNSKIKMLKAEHHTLASKLETLNPHDVLKRGYAIAMRADNQSVITNTLDIQPDDQVEVVLHQGRLTTKVEQTHG